MVTGFPARLFAAEFNHPDKDSDTFPNSTFIRTHIDAPFANLNISPDPEWDMTMD